MKPRTQEGIALSYSEQGIAVLVAPADAVVIVVVAGRVMDWTIVMVTVEGGIASLEARLIEKWEWR
jgi:hypothetical protein